MSNKSRKHLAALRYLKMGLAPIPLSGKKPLVEWKEFKKTPPTKKLVNEWWSKWPDANIGLVCGERYGFFVLDIDTKEAFEFVKSRRIGKYTHIAKSGQGLHLYFKHPGFKVKTTSALGGIKGLDIRGDGGIITAPPSVHKTGPEYIWKFDPEEYELAEAPEWLLEMLHKSESRRDTVNTDGVKSSLIFHRALTGFPKGQRNNGLTQVAGKLFQAGMDTGDVAGFCINVNKGNRPPLSAQEVYRIVTSIEMKHLRNFKGLRPESITASELLQKKFKPMQWAVEGLMPEGLTLLGGKPKTGKSILALNICLAVAYGGKALGEWNTEQGKTLYLGLEDGERRLQARLKQMKRNRRAPDNLELFTDFPSMDKGGLRELDRVMSKRKNLRLVVIDTLKKIKPEKTDRSKNIYDVDYENVAALRDLAMKHGVAMLVNHHLRKEGAEDIFDAFSGTLGLTAAADQMLAMVKKKSGGTELHIRGRDVEDAVYALNQNTSTMNWEVLGDAEEVSATELQQSLKKVLQDFSDENPASPKELAELTGLKKGYVGKTLGRLLKKGEVRKVGYGQYCLS